MKWNLYLNVYDQLCLPALFLMCLSLKISCKFSVHVIHYEPVILFPICMYKIS